jgi:hypothetical protein
MYKQFFKFFRKKIKKNILNIFLEKLKKFFNLKKIKLDTISFNPIIK